MGPAIGFWAGSDFAINDLSGSGLGFYGDAGFGASVQVGAWQGRTFITDATGALQGAECDNTKYLNATGVVLGQSGSGIPLNCIPNYLATVEVRFTNDTAVRTQNVYASIYDRTNPANPAVGVTTALYEVSHQATDQSPTGSGGPGTPLVSGNQAWYMFPGGVATSGMQLTSSPGVSGLRPSGANTADTTHTWYLSISSSPDTTGSHSQYGLYISLEYL